MTIQQRAVVTVLLAAAVVPVANAVIINVPADQSTIQAAIVAAMNGDEIVVAPGTYFETINFLGKTITLRSSDGPDVTTIDAQRTGTVVTCDSGEGSNTVLEGFTITGGLSALGAGMRNANSSPTVTNCVFIGNSGVNGGGMFNSGSSTVTNCTFSGNSAIGEFVSGGGMYNGLDSSPTVTDCTFNGNTAEGHNATGGGMFNGGSSPAVSNCTFTANTSTYRGAGMHNVSGSSPTVTNCTFEANSTTESGGGMWNSSGSNPTVTNCTFSGNRANLGGGMRNVSPATVRNCTFTGNEGAGIRNSGTGTTIWNCVLWNNSPRQINGSSLVRYSAVEGGWPGTGNIDADPLFVDPENGDYHLSPGSPCIDAGHNWGVPPDTADVDADGDVRELTPLDLDGNPRFADDPATRDTGCGVPIPYAVDMGVFEFRGTVASNAIYLGDLNADRVVGIVDFLALLANWGPADMCVVADLDLDGNVGITDFLILLGNWGP